MRGSAGDFYLGVTIDIPFTTVGADGVPTTLAGTPAVAAYVDNGTTEITAGITLSVDFDSRTGSHNVRVVATSGNGFAAGTAVALKLTAGTVGGVSVVGMIVGYFTIQKTSALRPSADGRQIVVEVDGMAHADLREWLGSAPSALSSGLVQAHVASIPDGLLTAAKFADAFLTAAKIAASAFESGKFASGAFDAVWSVATRLLTAGTNIVLAKGTGITGLNDLSAADIRAAVGLASANLDAQLAALPTAEEIADAIADEALAGHAVAGSVGEALARLDVAVSSRLATSGYTAPLSAAGTRTALGMATANLDTQLAALAAFVDTEVAAIVSAVAAIQAKTDNLPASPANETTSAAIKAKTDNLPASPAAVGSAMTLTSGERDAIAAALLDLANAIEANVSLRAAIRVIATVVAGNAAGQGGTTPSFTNPAGTKTRATGTTDEQGNRIGATWDGS